MYIVGDGGGSCRKKVVLFFRFENVYRINKFGGVLL